MSQLSHPNVPLHAQVRAHRLIALAALLALVATVAVVLVVAIGDTPSTSSTASTPQAAVRADGGPDESGVAAAIGSPSTVAGPDESAVASAISGR